MKRITALLLAAVFAFGGVSAARADGIDIKVKGQWDFTFGVINHRNFKDSAHGMSAAGERDDDNFEARQRIRTQINFISSEYLQAVMMFEIGGLDWGRNANGNIGQGAGGALDADGVNIETKRAYLDWIIPNTEVSVRMGIQGLTLPSTRLGSVVFDADVAGITISSPITDWLGASLFWARPFDAYRHDSTAFGGFPNNDNFDDETDLFGIVAPVEFDGIAFTPWFMYGFVGANSGIYDYMFGEGGTNSNLAENESSRAWWLGLNMELTPIDNLSFSMDAIYGRMNNAYLGHSDMAWSANLGGDAEHISASGWYLAAALDYSFDWGTPGLFGWYSSGDDANADDSGRIGRLPVVGTDGGFTATSFGGVGYYSIGNGDDWAVVSGTGTGTWGIGAQIADVSFIEDLSHTLRFAYYRGTNDSRLVEKRDGEAYLPNNADALYLTDDDSVYEVNFDHTYKIYENLEACLELGWLHLKTDRATWNAARGLDESEDAWKAEINFRYSF